MSTPLARRFLDNPKLSKRIAELMSAAKNRYRDIGTTCVGCGDAFITRYWPKFELLVNQGILKMTIIDKEPFEELVAGKLALAEQSNEQDSIEILRKQYDSLRQALRKNPRDVAYLNINDKRDHLEYWRMVQDLVFVLVPDDIHIQYAYEWLRRATLVLIEKPYNRSLVQAQCFEDTLSSMVRTNGQDYPNTIVVCIDHYLAKIFEYIIHQHEHRSQIGAIREIEFSVCEKGPVEPWRATSLSAGMIYDLFCHVLAQISPFIELDSLLHNNSEQTLLVARHEQCPIQTESYAYVENHDVMDRHGRRIVLRGVLGKGVGNEDCKHLRIIGDRGVLSADFGPASKGKLCITVDCEERPHFSIGKGHPEIIDSIFQGKFMREPVGGLPGEDAVKILKILTHMRTKVESCLNKLGNHPYPIFTPEEQIRSQAVKIL